MTNSWMDITFVGRVNNTVVDPNDRSLLSYLFDGNVVHREFPELKTRVANIRIWENILRLWATVMAKYYNELRIEFYYVMKRII